MEPEIIPIAVALIRKTESNGIFWLGRNQKAGDLLKFIVSQPLAGKSLRESITEEIAWELDLDRSKDFLVSNMAQLNFDFPESVPAVKNAQPLKVTFYNVELYRRSVRQQLDDDPRSTWLSSTEIWDGRAENGLRLDPFMQQIITRSEVIRAWETSSGISE